MSQPDQRRPGDRPRWTAVSIVLLVVGLVVLIPSAIVTWILVAEETDRNVIALVIAGGSIPIAAGAALVYAAVKFRPPAEPPWTIVSGALFVLGLLILFPASSCTVFFGGSVFVEGLGTADLSTLFLVLFTGGVPVAIGVALVYAATKLRRKA